VLLHNTPMRLKRGHRYGLCGHNGAGKTTLMNSIASGKVRSLVDESCMEGMLSRGRDGRKDDGVLVTEGTRLECRAPTSGE